MSDTALLALSAFGSIARPGRHGAAAGPAGVRVAERVGLGLVSVVARKGKAGALAAAAEAAFGVTLPTTPRRVDGDGIAFVWSGPDQWLAVAEPARAGSIEADLRRAFTALASLAEQSDGRGVQRLAGPRLRDTLAKGIALDLDPRVFAPGDTAITMLSHVGVQLWQIDDRPSFDLLVPRGYAGSIWHWLEGATAEYGLDCVPD